MQFNIEYRPSYALAICQLQPGEAVRAEGGAMVSMSTHLRMETSASGGKGIKGFLKGLARKVFLGESFFMNTFHADQAPGEVTFAATMPGDMEQTMLNNESLVIQGSSYVCSSPDIETTPSTSMRSLALAFAHGSAETSNSISSLAFSAWASPSSFSISPWISNTLGTSDSFNDMMPIFTR